MEGKHEWGDRDKPTKRVSIGKETEDAAMAILEDVAGDDDVQEQEPEETELEAEEQDSEETQEEDDDQPRDTPRGSSDWTAIQSEYTPEDIAKAIEESRNAKAMRREAHDKYNEAKSLHTQNEQFLRTMTALAASGKRDAALDLLTSFSHEQAGMSPSSQDDPDDELSSLRRQQEMTQRQLAAMQANFANERVREATLAHVDSRDALRDLPPRIKKQLVDSVRNRLIERGATLENLAEMAREVIQEEADVYEGLERDIVNRYRAKKKPDPKKPIVPKGTGRRAAALSQPKQSKRPNVTKDGWDAMEKKVLEELRRISAEGE